ncbi:hypothetical protein M404DRAFT_993484 [Pisolithus tinctorius Marx 270]|uniref:Uncharacterized protein n=1 Tax=Pisolithus tinctorius Marx 270 TaxID=870435 RepID=A0A0C3PUL2_PISTI|nr:hypothetical protein M404DRAFT_993484 [Pisolithus tinctorius Marx 270]
MASVGRLSSECHHLWTADSSPPLLTHVRYALADFKKYKSKIAGTNQNETEKHRIIMQDAPSLQLGSCYAVNWQ